MLRFLNSHWQWIVLGWWEMWICLWNYWPDWDTKRQHGGRCGSIWQGRYCLALHYSHSNPPRQYPWSTLNWKWHICLVYVSQHTPRWCRRGSCRSCRQGCRTWVWTRAPSLNMGTVMLFCLLLLSIFVCRRD